MAGQFVSPGALAGNALEDFFLKRDQLARQAMLDKLRQEEQQSEIVHRNAQDEFARRQLGVTEANQQAIREQQKSALEATAYQREFQQAQNFANSPPGLSVDEATAARQARHGFGGYIKTVPGVVTQGPQIGFDDIPEYEVSQTPTTRETLAGPDWQRREDEQTFRAEQARLAAEEKAAQSAAAKAADAARAREHDETLRAVAGTRASTQQETAALRNELLRGQITDAETKRTVAQETADRATQAARQTAGDVIDLIGKLGVRQLDGTFKLNDAAANLFGARVPGGRYIPGSETAVADSVLNRLKGRAVLDLIAEMKAQSRTGATGFGQINIRELELLENSATRLTNANISDASAAEELGRLDDLVAKYVPDAATAATQKKTDKRSVLPPAMRGAPGVVAPQPRGRGGLRVLAIEEVR